MLITFVLYFLALLLFSSFPFFFQKIPLSPPPSPNYPRQCVRDGALGHMCFGHKCGGGGWPRISASHNKFDPLPHPPPPPSPLFPLPLPLLLPLHPPPCGQMHQQHMWSAWVTHPGELFSSQQTYSIY